MYTSRRGRPHGNPYLIVTRESLATGQIGVDAVRNVLWRLTLYNTPASLHARKVLLKWLMLIDMAARD